MPNTQTNPTATVDRVARKAEQALDTTQQVANDTIDSLKDRVHAAPAAFSRAAEQVQDFTRRSIERAHDLSVEARDRAQRAGDRTVAYIQDEPVKAVLIAAATGAAVALLVRALSGRRGE